MNVFTKFQVNWGESEFKLLGLHYSVDIDKIPQINYINAINKVCNLINLWQNRSLTPLGKVTVIKTLLLPQFNHLFTSLLTSKNILDSINRLFFQFLWDKKPEKIRRNTIYRDYNQGGIKMINVYHFENSQKLSWIKRLISQNSDDPPPWYTLLTSLVGDLGKITTLGGDWCKMLEKKIDNPFCKHIFKQWAQFCRQRTPENNSELIQSPLWFNSQISNVTLFLPKWQNKGITIIDDIVNPQGDILNCEEIKNMYQLRNIEFDYYRVRSLIRTFINKYKIGNNFVCEKPHIPTHIKILTKPNKVSRDFYQQQNKLIFTDSPLCELTWNRSLNISLNKRQWVNVYKACFQVSSDNSVKWFQYRVLNQILGTRYRLFKMNISTNSLCGLCDSNIETVQHLMSECSESNVLWSNICTWIKNRLNIDVCLSNEDKILAYVSNNSNYVPLNFILIHSRKYIFWCAKNMYKLNFYMLQQILKNCFFEEESLAKLHFKLERFNHVWSYWKNLFVNY